jgi:hypothetical protein
MERSHLADNSLPPPGLVGLMKAVVLKPKAAMRHVADRPGRTWLVPIVLTAVLGVAGVVVGREAALETAREQFSARQTRMRETGVDADTIASAERALEGSLGFGVVLTATAAVIGPFVGAVVVAAVMHLAGTVLGGQQTFLQMLAASAWARLPLAMQSGLRLIAGLVGVHDPSPDGLSGLAVSATGASGTSFLGPPLAEISLWNLWSLALLAVAMQVVSRVSARKAVAAVAAFVVLKIIVGEFGVAASRFAADFANF